jgi:hypothetical protein
MNRKQSDRKNRILTIAAFLIVAMTVVACNFSLEIPASNKQIQPPQINSGSIRGYLWNDLCDGKAASSGCVRDALTGRYFADGIFSADEGGIADIQISLGNGVCPSRGKASVLSNQEGYYQFDALAAGDYCISVDYPGSGRVAKLVAGKWTYPRTDNGIGVGSITLTLSKGEIRDSVNFGWDAFSHNAQDQIDDPPKSPESEECVNKARFVKDVTVPDGSRFSTGEAFTKIWRLKNDGSCAWSSSYSLDLFDGDRMNAPERVNLPHDVPPGEEIDIQVSLQAPEAAGSFKGYWMLREENGSLFGIGENADKPFWVKVHVGNDNPRESVVSWEYELNPDRMADEGRWIDVNLGQQLLTAYDGSTPIMHFVISSGTASTPTVTGQFRIWVKLSTTDMNGPGYSLEDVPFTMYFYQGYGLHGTYWHDNFGTPMSHGCVNLRTPDASWLFDFASEGTLVNIHP